MGVIKAKHVDLTKISHGIPRKIIDKNYTVPIYYDGGPLLIQLPRSQLFTGVYESDSKYYCELLIPPDGVACNVYERIAEVLQATLKKSHMFENAPFAGHMRTINVENTASMKCMRVKFPQCKSKILTSISQLATQEPLSLAHVQKGCVVVPVVSLEYVYVVNGFMGFNLLMKEMAIV